MKKISFIFTISIYLFAVSFSYANNFNARIDEEKITVTGKPGKSYSVTINLETNNPSLTVYPVNFSFPDQNTYSTNNTWLTPSVSSLNINNYQATSLIFTLSIPSDITVGEYYKAVGVSDIIYSDNSDAIVVSIPVIVQVTENGEESVTNDDSDGSTSNSSTSASTSTTSTTNNQTTSGTSPTPTSTKTEPKQTKKPTPTKTIDIFSKLVLTDLKTKYSLLKQSTNIDLKLTNEGNIYSIPSGSIQVRDSKNNPIKFFSLNPNKKIVKPTSHTNFNYQLDLPPYYLGLLKLDVYLGSTNSQDQTPAELVKTINFLHLDTIPLVLIVSSLGLIIKNKSKKKYLALQTLVGFLLLFTCYHLSSKITNPNSLAETTSLNVNATVKNQIGLKVISDNVDSKTIVFVSNNTSGCVLYSLTGNSRILISEVVEISGTNHTVNLNASQSANPVLMITSGY